MCYRGLQKCSKLLLIQAADPGWDLQGFYCIERAHLQLDMNTGLYFLWILVTSAPCTLDMLLCPMLLSVAGMIEQAKPWTVYIDNLYICVGKQDEFCADRLQD